MNDRARLALAEAFGTAVLVIGGPGTAILAAGAPSVGLDGAAVLGVAIAFGLSLLVMAYTIGGISGCHINPAVTVGLWVLGKTKTADVPIYIVSQIAGGIIGALAIFVIANGIDGFDASDGFASNGWGNLSPNGYDLGPVAIAEIIATFVFVTIVISTSRADMPAGFTGVSIGLALTLVHLVTIPVSNTSVNPARSIATAVFQTGDALEQLWAFLVFPTIGAVLAGLFWKFLHAERETATAARSS
ncbi:MAG: aquaporin Z [Acidimicrobiales bacterium]